MVGDSALLLATKGQIRWNMVNTSVTTAEEGLPVALDFVNRALALDPDHHVAIFVRGLVAATGGRVEAALEDLHKALSLKPGDANMWVEWVRWSLSSGLMGTAQYVKEQRRADPLNPLTYISEAWEAAVRGRYEEIASLARHAIELSSAPPLHKMAGWFLAEAGLTQEAIEVLRRGSAAAPSGDSQRPQMLFLAGALEGDEQQALQHAEAEERGQSEWEFLPLAAGYGLLGHGAKGVQCLKRATEAGFIDYPFMAEQCRLLDGLRRDPGFAGLMAEVKPRWEAVVEWERGLP
jgi:tetratricopeptide (TPR) repeat protein